MGMELDNQQREAWLKMKSGPRATALSALRVHAIETRTSTATLLLKALAEKK
jgi:hypothetical protein